MSLLVRHRRLLPLLLGWAFAATTARALRAPNDFALAHWLLDYRLGPIKRGLAGSTATLVTGGAPGESALVVASWLVFAASTTALLYALWQLATRVRGPDGPLLALVLAGSPLVVMHAHLVGYLDGVVIALAVPAIALALRGRVAAGSLLLALAVPVHEMTLVVALPAFLLAVHRAGGDTPHGGGALRRAAAPAVAVFALLAAAQALQPPGVLREAVAGRLAAQPWLDPVIAGLLPGWLTDSFVENLRQCADGLVPRALWAVAPALVAPALLAAAWAAWPALRARRQAAVFLAVCALPQTAHLFAWDAPRLWTWSLLAALFAAWVVTVTAPPPGEAPHPRPDRRFARPARLALVGVLLLDLWLTIPLMDSQVDHLSRPVRLLLHLPILAGALALALERPRGPGVAPALASPGNP